MVRLAVSGSPAAIREKVKDLVGVTSEAKFTVGEFSLPIRLGLASSSGTQDLIVNILVPDQRYEVANYESVYQLVRKVTLLFQ